MCCFSVLQEALVPRNPSEPAPPRRPYTLAGTIHRQANVSIHPLLRSLSTLRPSTTTFQGAGCRQVSPGTTPLHPDSRILRGREEKMQRPEE